METGNQCGSQTSTCKVRPESITVQHNKAERVTYAGRSFSLTLHVTREKWEPSNNPSMDQWAPAMQQLINTNQKFPIRAHHLTRWYGVNSFVVLSPVTGNDELTSQAQAKLMLSSVAIAIKNTGCNLPIFVQLRERWRQLYQGWCEAGSMQCIYEMAHLKHIPTNLGHLAGLLDLFKAKVACPLPRLPQPVQLTVRYTYVLRHWQGSHSWIDELSPSNQSSPNPASSGGNVTMTTFHLGTKLDPLLEIHLSAVWPHLSEQLIVDNVHHSQLNPLEAPIWSITVRLADNSHCKLATSLDSFLRLCYYQETMKDILGEGSNKSSQDSNKVDGVTKALLRITESQFESQFSTPLMDTIRHQSRSHDPHAISDDNIDNIIEHLFPEGENYKDANPTDNLGSGMLSSTPLAVPIGSFTHHLAICLSNTATMGVHAIAEVWQEVTSELRHHWETGQPIPRINKRSPDMSYCLLHQKLQMLNCCIYHKISTNQNTGQVTTQHTTQSTIPANPASLTSQTGITQQDTTSSERTTPLVQATKIQSTIQRTIVEDTVQSATPGTTVQDMSTTPGTNTQDTNSEDDEEFYEAQEEVLNESSDHVIQSSDHVTGETIGDTVWEGREGVLHQYQDLVLIATGEPLCIPITQDIAPFTEDMVLEQQQVLAKLGTSEEAGKLRAKMQSASLLSDMQAFKAANPNCLLEDFVRWYSPRDWIKFSNDVTDPEDTPPDQLADVTTDVAIDNQPDAAVDNQLNAAIDNQCDAVIDNQPDAAIDNQPDAAIDNHPDAAIDNHQPDVAIDNQHEGWDEEWAMVEEVTTVVKYYAHGKLSQRMQQEGNTWLEAWQIAEPLPVSRQKKLFDHTTEAEKVLHYLESLRPVDISLQLIPLLIMVGIGEVQCKLHSELRELNCVEHLLVDCVHFITSITHRPSLNDLPKLQECIKLLAQAEHQLSSAVSVRNKLISGFEMSGKPVSLDTDSNITTSMRLLMETPELVIDNNSPQPSATADALRGLLTAEAAAVMNIDEIDIELDGDRHKRQSRRGLPSEAGKEFLLWTIAPNPAEYSIPCPQRLFCVLTPDEFRLAGAFTSDTNII
ncbi:rab3 GTPase-activating protein catalytic subunit-like isoform X3 [Dysidea avara]|uniref:rab3 GTPase-activating protein catalytic subunit-like isoform X3 n=1 Tax=Dysidea avara TaxID=196820 RepID=UPI003318102D